MLEQLLKENKFRQSTSVTFRCPVVVIKALTSEATKLGISRSEAINQLLQAWYFDFEEKKKERRKKAKK